MSIIMKKINPFQIITSLKRSVTYKSSLSLDKLYPNSSLKITTPSMCPNIEKFNGYIPLDQLDITYSKSTGPGGQNVNKVNTKVEIRFQLNSATWLNDEIKKKMSDRFKNKLTKEGYVIFRSDITRSQQLNLADCLEKIRTSIRSCSEEETKPSPETEEKIRRRIEKASKERLAMKRYKSQIKQDRQVPAFDM